MRGLIPLTFVLLGSAAHAETLFPMPSVPDVSDGDGWAFAIGAEVEYEAEYDGSDEYSTEVEPGFVIQKRSGDSMWFLEGQELGDAGQVAGVAQRIAVRFGPLVCRCRHCHLL